MVQYLITFKIQEANRADTITALEWIKDNYGAEVQQAASDLNAFSIDGHIAVATFVLATTAISAFETEFGSKLDDQFELLVDITV